MTPTAFTDLHGETLLDNERLLVERYVVPPGEATGPRATTHHHLLIFIHGGVVTAGDGRAVIWTDGRVHWLDAADRTARGWVNAGDADVVFVCVTLKGQPHLGDVAATSRVEPLGYPNIPGEDLLDNEWVIVQRFCIGPGQWEGVHAHQPNMLFVHITGGHWGARSYGEPFAASTEPSPDGSVGWMDPVGIEFGHESCNIGTEPIDLVWVSLKH